MKYYLTGLLLILQTIGLSAQTSKEPDSVSRKIDAYIKVQMRRNFIPGLSLAVVKDGKIIKIKGYGLSNIETNTPATPETIYRIGSLSKQFLATGIMLLVQEHKIGLDDKISKYLEGTPGTWKEITVRELLAHTSGIVRNQPDFDPLKLQTDSAALSSTFAVPLNFAPGSKWEYSNMNYYALAEIIKKVSGKPWSQFITEHIFVPTGMSQTRTTSLTDIVRHRAAGYTTEAKGLENADIWITLRPSGAFLSNVIDLAKWDAMLYTETILKTTSKSQMWLPVLLNDGTTYPYGFGWYIDTINGHKRFHHDGGVPGFKADMERYVNDKLTIIILANNGSTHGEKIAQHIAGFYIPALTPELEKPINDTKPQIKAKVKKMIDGFINGNLDLNMFATNIVPEMVTDKAYYKQTFSSSGKIQAFSLVERKTTGDRVFYRYRLDYRYDSFFVSCEFDQKGIITGMGTGE